MEEGDISYEELIAIVSKPSKVLWSFSFEEAGSSSMVVGLLSQSDLKLWDVAEHSPPHGHATYVHRRSGPGDSDLGALTNKATPNGQVSTSLQMGQIS